MSRWIRPLLASAVFACAAQLVFADDSTAVDSAKLFTQLDTNGDDAVSEDEVPKDKQPLLKRLMRTADKNGDGRLSREEFVAGLKGADKPKSTDETSTAVKESKKAESGKTSADKSDERAALRARLGNGDGQGIAALISRMDKNGDGKVTPDEVPEERRDRFKAMLGRLDKNNDGAISKDELPKPQSDGKDSSGSTNENSTGGRPGLAGAGGRDINQLRQRMKEADKNGDGKLSKEEMPERMAPLFGRLDKDNDGFVDSTELRAGMEQMRERAALEGKKQDLNQQENKLDAQKTKMRRQAKLQAAKKRANKQEAKKAKEVKQDSKQDKSDGPKKNDADGKPA